MPRPHLVGTFLALSLALPLGGCVALSSSGAESVAFGGRADRVEDVRTSVVAHHVATAPGTTVRITNIAGRIELRQGEGDVVAMEAQVHARGASDAHTEELLAGMQWIETTDDDGRSAWGLAWPLDRHSTLHYVTDGRAFTMKSQRHGGVTVTTEKRPGAPTLFADMIVTYPAGTPIEVGTLVGDVAGGALRGSLGVHTTVGDVGIESFDGALSLDTGSGDIVVHAADGTSNLDTGSGDIRVRSLSGTASLDTGSGRIEVGSLAGDADFDTGSGDIVVGSAGARRVRADTGSGDIRLAGGTVDELDLDTGSGSIEITAVDFVKLHGDTGSGDILIRGSLERAEEIRADTGSGNVTIVAGPGASFDAHARLASGRMQVGFDDVTVERDGRHAMRARRGDGRTHIRVGTGSGDCRVEPGS